MFLRGAFLFRLFGLLFHWSWSGKKSFVSQIVESQIRARFLQSGLAVFLFIGFVEEVILIVLKMSLLAEGLGITYQLEDFVGEVLFEDGFCVSYSLQELPSISEEFFPFLNGWDKILTCIINQSFGLFPFINFHLQDLIISNIIILNFFLL